MTERRRSSLAWEVVPFEAYHPVDSSDDATRSGPDRLNILVLMREYPGNASTIQDHAQSLQRHSRHNYFYWDCYAAGGHLPDGVNLDYFDVVVIHYSVYLLHGANLAADARKKLAQTRARIVVFRQDEYARVDDFIDALHSVAADVLFTCVPASEVPKVYPESRLPHVRIFSTLTGFVPECLEKDHPDFDAQRPIDIGYRGRSLDFFYGELAMEKTWIAEGVKARCREAGLICDISIDEADRLYGEAWLNFMRSCRCTLGTESGASVFDFSGDIERDVKRYIALHPEATFFEVREKFFKDLEGKIRLNQISPRIFEAIGCGSCLILFVGDYSGLLKPDLHYIPLQKGFSNWSEVLEKVRDPQLVRSIARRAYDDIIGSRTYAYDKFAEGFDRALAQAFPPETFSSTRRVTATAVARRQSLRIRFWRLALRIWLRLPERARRRLTPALEPIVELLLRGRVRSRS